MSEKQSTGDWYCRNCGYLSGQRVTYHETCDTCHQPVEVHDANEASALTLALAENERLRKALEEIAFEPFGDADASDHEVLNAITLAARAALTPPAKEVPSA